MGFSFGISLDLHYLCRQMNKNLPKIAIVDANTLAAIGLKQLLQSLVPAMQVDVYGSIAELIANHPDCYYHYFVAMNIVLENRDYFMSKRQKTIVLTTSSDGSKLSDFHCLHVNVSEHLLVRSLLILQQQGHHEDRHLSPHNAEPRILSDREAEVMVLIVKGYINKEIASQLHIGLSTVITHRKNIMEKLGVKSVSALTIYAVMHGYVDINKI